MNSKKHEKPLKLLPYFQITAVLILIAVFFIIIGANIEKLIIPTDGIPFENRFLVGFGGILAVIALSGIILVRKRRKEKHIEYKTEFDRDLDDDVILRDIKKPGIEQKYSRVLEGKNVSHEFDRIIKKGDKIYLIEIKHRLIVPSDIENYGYIYQDITVKNKNVKGIVLITTVDPTDTVQRMGKDKGIHIIKPEDLEVLKTV